VTENQYQLKKIPPFIVALLFITHCFAQQLVERKGRLTTMVTEKFQTVIEKSKQVKQGLYHAFYNKNTVIASGNYTDDKRTGVWHFFNQGGKLSENFNYDTQKLTYEAPEDTTSNIRYVIDNKINGGDHVTKPVRLGGRYFGYVPYLRLFKLPADMVDVNPAEFIVVLELLISPGGRLADYRIHIKSASYERVLSIGTDLLSEEDRQFLPAGFNNQPISSTIFIQCYIDKYGGIDM
jgi:hypothetical protein